GVAGRVDRDAMATVTPSPAEVGGVDGGRAGGIELRHEGIAGALLEGGLEGPHGRKVERVGEPCHVGVAGGVHGDAAALVKPVPAEIGGIREGWIDDEWQARIVGGDVKPDPLPIPEDVAAGDLDPPAGNLLIDDWLVLANGHGCRVEHEVALGVDFESLCTLEAQLDAARIR